MRVPALALAAFALAAPPACAAGLDGRCATERGGARGLLALHGYWSAAGALASPAAPLDSDEDDVAILEDRGDLVVRKNPFDLDGAALRLSPNGAGGYDPARLALPLDPAGDPLQLGDDDARPLDLPFTFVFYGHGYTRVFLHSDGHLSFGAPDIAQTERGLARFLSGPPRVAPLFADLDPSRGGTVTARLLPDRATFLWDGVPGAGQISRSTFQVTLYPGGALDFVYGPEVQTREAVVGLSPGGTLEVTPADLSAARPSGTKGAIAERFSETEKLDLVSVARRFFASHPDRFDQLVIYTTRPLNPVGGTLAFELNVRNDVEGIGVEVVDDSRQWGSEGVLSSVVFMDSIDTYLDVDGFEILGHEVGHLWLARLRFRDSSGSVSAALVGRDGVHWSFFLDSDASLMEGNDIADRGGGRFETVDFARGFSALDEYAMGLRLPQEVPAFFYVDDPDDFRPNAPFKSSSPPEAGVSFTGARRDVRIDEVVAAMGSRVPDASRAPHVLRQAFILVSDGVAGATEERRHAMARIRAGFEVFFRDATGGRGLADTTLP